MDVTLVSDDLVCLKAHKFVLSACSPVLKDILLKNKENVEEKTDKMLLEFIKDLSKRLNENVFIKGGEYIINQTRVILDLPILAMKSKV